MLKKYRDLSFMKKVLLFMAIGIVLGIAFGEKIVVIDFLGKIFLSLMMMAAIPLVVVNLIKGIAELGDVKAFGRMGIKILIYYCTTTVLASGVGLVVAHFFNPGEGFDIAMETYEGSIAEIPGLGEVIRGFIPSNIFASLSNGRLDQIVVYCVFFGIAILLMKPEAKSKLINGVNVLADVVNNIMKIVLGYAPFGIGCLIATTVGKYGSMLIGFAAKYIASCYLSFVIMLVIYITLFALFTKKNVFSFIKQGLPGFVTGFSTSSSLATLPTNMQCAEKMGISKSVYGFTIPLGSQINKDGAAVMFATNLIFAAGILGMELSTSMIINAMFLILMLTTGLGSVAGGSTSSTAIMFDTIGLPLDMLGVFTGLLPMVDPGCTAMNCYGDLVGTAIVASSEEKRSKRAAERP